MKALLIAGFIASAASMKIQKGYLGTPGNGYYNQIASPTVYYSSPYAQVSPYYSQTPSQVYPQTLGLTQSYPATDGMNFIPAPGLTQVLPTSQGMTQSLQPTAMTYPIQENPNYNPNFLGVQPSNALSANAYYNPLGQQYYSLPEGSQMYSPMGPTYYQTNDPSPSIGSTSFYDYFQ